MSEESNADDDIAFQGETLLHLQELLLEPSATTKGYDLVLADHYFVFIPFLFNIPFITARSAS